MKDEKPINVRLVNLKMVRERSLKYEEAATHATAIINMVKPLFENIYREIVLVVGLDNKNKPTVIHTVGTGSPNQSPVYISNVFKPLLLSNSIGFILIHNHPSSTLTPSPSDCDITDKLKTAGKLLDIQILDHIVLNSDCTQHYSFKQAGNL